jgi:DNA adenine methylase
LGGGALLFLAAKPNSVAGDIFEPLISFWNLVKNEPEIIINNYQEQWQLLQDQGFTYFYEVRERFNREMNPFDLNFITRTCVNGIVRFNNEGKFNNSFHVSRPGMNPDKFRKIVDQWSERIQCVKFVCQDYLKTILEAKAGDFVYFDPPYACNKDRYIENLDQDRFFKALEILNQKDIKWALSYDGRRGLKDYQKAFPEKLYKRRLFVRSGNSAVRKVLHGPIECVEESLYLNY